MDPLPSPGLVILVVGSPTFRVRCVTLAPPEVVVLSRLPGFAAAALAAWSPCAVVATAGALAELGHGFDAALSRSSARVVRVPSEEMPDEELARLLAVSVRGSGTMPSP